MSMPNRCFMIRRLIAAAILLFGLSQSGIVQGAALVADHQAVREFDAIPDLMDPSGESPYVSLCAHLSRIPNRGGVDCSGKLE